MRIRDFLKLGAANITAHRKRATKVVMIVGVLFGVLLMASMLIQGVENAVLAKMNRPLGGKVLLGTTVNTQYYKEPQAEEIEQERIREKIWQYGGEIIETETYQMAGVGEVAVLPEELVQEAIEVDFAERPAEAVPMVVPVGTVMRWLNIDIPQRDSAERAAAKVIKAREQALGRTIELGSGQKIYIAGLSSSTAGRSSLSLSGVGQEVNPLNLILGVVPLGSSMNYIIDDGKTDLEKLIITEEEPEIPEEWLEVFPELAVPKVERVWAAFPDLATASGYYYDAENYCEQANYAYGVCETEYKYSVTPGFNDPFAVVATFKTVWTVFDVVAVVLAVIGVIVMLTTYLRLVGQDTKVIALYRANGATKGQVVGIYVAYLVMLSLLAAVFAIVLAMVLTLIVNLVNGAVLSQAFTLGLGMPEQAIVLIGLNKWELILAVIMIAVAPVTVLISLGQFSGKNLARKLK